MNSASNGCWTGVQTAGCGKPIILVHGFGASVGHYRKNIAVLSKTHKVGVMPKQCQQMPSSITCSWPQLAS
jgi:hypothetical protein